MVTLKKYHGLGNDYLIYDPNQNRELLQERQIQLLCRRNTGVGADGTDSTYKADISSQAVRLVPKALSVKVCAQGVQDIGG